MKNQLIFIALIMGIVLISGCIQEKPKCIQEKPKTNNEKMYIRPDYFQGNFTVIGTPLLNQSFDLMFSVEPIVDLPNVRIKLFLPPSVKVIDGMAEWSGDLKKGRRVELNTTLMLMSEGEWEIRAYVEGEYKESKSYFIFLKTTENDTQIRSTPSKGKLQQTPHFLE